MRAGGPAAPAAPADRLRQGNGDEPPRLAVIEGAGSRPRALPPRDAVPDPDDRLVDRLALWLADVATDVALASARSTTEPARASPRGGRSR